MTIRVQKMGKSNYKLAKGILKIEYGFRIGELENRSLTFNFF